MNANGQVRTRVGEHARARGEKRGEMREKEGDEGERRRVRSGRGREQYLREWGENTN